MSEELEDKYLAVLQQSFKERLELRKKNKALQEEIELIKEKLDNEQNTKSNAIKYQTF